jgi:hypothetical protein
MTFTGPGGYEMHYFTFVLFSLVLTWFMLTANSRRRVAVVTVTAVLVSTLLIVPPSLEAQGGLVPAIQAVLKVLNTLILPVVKSINGTRGANNTLFQSTVWPVQSINQATAQVLQMMGQYNNLMARVLGTTLRSATLPAPQAMESLLRDHQVNNFSGLTQSYNTTYRNIPAPSDASQADRDMSDIDDALVLDNFKTLKASDSATDLELQTADSIESGASQAAAGSAPFLTATAAASGIRSQAVTQKMLAAELRQEAARLAHQNGLRKRGAVFTTQLRGVLMNLLQHN